jgi:hypothetical protein
MSVAPTVAGSSMVIPRSAPLDGLARLFFAGLLAVVASHSVTSRLEGIDDIDGQS